VQTLTPVVRALFAQRRFHRSPGQPGQGVLASGHFWVVIASAAAGEHDEQSKAGESSQRVSILIEHVITSRESPCLTTAVGQCPRRQSTRV
jgi:hypothetical protein